MKNNKMRKIYLLILLITLLLGNTFVGCAQHKIEINMPEFAGDTLIFGHYFREQLIIKDSAILGSDGTGYFEGKDILPGGLYTVYLPNKNRFDVLIDKDQHFSITADTSDLVRNTIIKNNIEDELFFNYQKYIMDIRKKIVPIEKRITNPVSSEDSILAKKQLESINIEVTNHIQEILKENPNLFLSKFLLSMKEVEVPEPPRDENCKITDSTFQYRYYKAHYFDNFDISDVRLLRTPFYEKKVLNYLDKMVIPNPDSIYKEVDFLIEKSRTDTFLFKYMVTTLFNHYAQSNLVGMDAVYAYIAEKYYIPEASWADSKFVSELKERVVKLKPLLIGKDAPDIQLVKVSDDHFKQAGNDTLLKKNPYIGEFFNLRKIQAKFIILYFWEADCGHCQKTIPVLHQVYNRLKDKGVEVVSVHMLSGIEGKIKWIDFVNKEKLYGWINAWNPYDFAYREIYDINSSNILYLIDENKKILAKKIDPEQAEQIILNEFKKKNK